MSPLYFWSITLKVTLLDSYWGFGTFLSSCKNLKKFEKIKNEGNDKIFSFI